METISMSALRCPFCGVASDVPHETQERCIAALHAEITRLRGIVEKVKHTPGEPDAPPVPGPPPELDTTDETTSD
jgi:hypothetical protein